MVYRCLVCQPYAWAILHAGKNWSGKPGLFGVPERVVAAAIAAAVPGVATCLACAGPLPCDCPEPLPGRPARDAQSSPART